MYVYITGYGLRPFIPTETNIFEGMIQYRGKYKLPKNTKLTGGSKWVELDFWFTESQIYLRLDELDYTDINMH